MTVRADPDAERGYVEAGWWGTRTVGEVVRHRAAERPGATAFVDERSEPMSWAAYDATADAVRDALLSTGLAPRARVAVVLPDGPLVHAAYVGIERAGLVVVGIGNRAGDAELAHLLGRTGAEAIVTAPGRDVPPVRHHLVVPRDLDVGSAGGGADRDPIGPSELFLLNSTSGTTGLPKCVMQTQNRWVYFHRKAVEFGGLREDDVCMSVVPTPFGFGLWTSHFTPTLLGAPCVVMERFSADGMLELIERHRVTVLSCVTTQFVMALNSPGMDRRDLSSLRVMFTGGEAIQYGRAEEFEQRTGATLLNFYGSNETGMLSGTRVGDERSRRLTTGGRCVPEMHVRLFDEGGRPLGPDARRGVPGCKGPATALGYFDDDEANAALFTSDGWMLMGDVVELDGDWLTVVGRTSDFVIRGGKNISAPAVEAEIDTHPAVRLAAVVAAPDPVFGERVAAYVEVEADTELTLDDLRSHLLARGMTKEWLPEHLFVVDELPRSSGGKVAKGELRADAARRVEG